MNRNLDPMLVWSLRLTVLALAVSFIIFGVMRAEELAIWQKATKICFDCIGIG